MVQPTSNCRSAVALILVFVSSSCVGIGRRDSAAWLEQSMADSRCAAIRAIRVGVDERDSVSLITNCAGDVRVSCGENEPLDSPEPAPPELWRVAAIQIDGLADGDAMRSPSLKQDAGLCVVQRSGAEEAESFWGDATSGADTCRAAEKLSRLCNEGRSQPLS